MLLKFEARERQFVNVSFSGIRILGGGLLTPQSPDVFETLFRQIARPFPDWVAIEVPGLSTTSSLWNFLRNDAALKRNFVIYSPDGLRNCHTAAIPDSYAA